MGKIKGSVLLALGFILAFMFVFASSAMAKTSYDLEGYDNGSSPGWTDGALKGYAELDYVPFRVIVDGYGGEALDICIAHDYQDEGATSGYPGEFGYGDVQNPYIGDLAGDEYENFTSSWLIVAGPTDYPNGSDIMMHQYCFDLSAEAKSALTGKQFCIYWETQLQGPLQASEWSGASLHTRVTSGGGNEDVPIHSNGIEIAPAISLAKEAIGDGEYCQGEPVEYEFTITNLGNVVLTDVNLIDEDLGLNILLADLQPEGNLVHTEVYALDEEPGYYTNHAMVTAEDLYGTEVSAAAEETVLLVDMPMVGLNLEKMVNGAESYEGYLGEQVEYDFEITNYGCLDLSNIILDDNLLNSLPITITSLPAGETTIVEVFYTIPTDGTYEAGDTIINQASVSVTVDQVEYNSYDKATITVMDRPDAAIEVTKEAVPTEVYPDEDVNVTYTFTVANVGAVDLTNLQIYDIMFPGLDLGVTELEAGADPIVITVDYLIPANTLAGSIINDVLVTADSVEGSVEDTDNEIVTILGIPNVEISKVADRTLVEAGETVDYTFTVTNTGNVALTDFTLNDPLIGITDLLLTEITLEPGEFYITEPYGFDTTGLELGEFINTVEVNGVYEDQTVTATDDETIMIREPGTEIPAITITKILVDDQPNYPGEEVVYQFIVENTGDFDLTDILVTDYFNDSEFSDLEWEFTWDGILEPGATITLPDVDGEIFTIPTEAVAGTYLNTAEVTAVYGMDGEISDTDTAELIVFGDIELTKEADLSSLYIGRTVTYTLTLTNNNDVALENAVITDPLFGEEWSYEFSTEIAPGESKAIEVEYTVPSGTPYGNLINTALATGYYGDMMVEDEASATILVKRRTSSGGGGGGGTTEPTEPPVVVDPPIIIEEPVEEIPAEPGEILEEDVEEEVPVVLPATGGVGPQIYYAIGTLLVAAGYGFRRKMK